MSKLSSSVEKFLEEARAVTEPVKPGTIQKTQEVVTENIESSVRKPVWSLTVVSVVVFVFLVGMKPQCVLESRNKDWITPIHQKISWYKLVRAWVCLSLLVWVVLYLLLGALTTSSYWVSK